MPVKRLGVASPAANVETLLAVSDVVCVASIIVTNRGTVELATTIFVEPVDAVGVELSRSYVASNLVVSQGQTFETFRFSLNIGDRIIVSATTNSASFSVTAAYEQAGLANIVYQPIQPGFPSVGDIWIDSETDNVSLFTGTSFNTIATVAPTGPTGPAGPLGPTGPDGPIGPEGSSVRVLGTYATLELLQFDNATGAIGDAYVIDGDIYAWSDLNQEWALIGPLQGPTGPTGATGVQGDVGIGGPIGETGPTGATGPSGGPTGPTGPEGAVGPTGATGETGLAGSTGPAGADSTVAGPTGATGASGGITLNVTSPNGGIYIVNGADNPVLSFIRGHRYVINVNASNHPFYFQTSSLTYDPNLVYTDGVTGSGTDVGTIIFEVPYDAPSSLTYVCSNHANMGNNVIVSDLGPTGPTGATGADSTVTGPTGATGDTGPTGATPDLLRLETGPFTADHTFALTDLNKVVVMDGTTLTAFVPLNDTVAFPLGSRVHIYNAAAATFTVAGVAGVTVRNAGTVAQYQEVHLRKRDTNEWVMEL